MNQSGWGKLNERCPFNIIAVDLDRAYAQAGLNNYEQAIMQYVRENAWLSIRRKDRRPVPVPWDLKAIADEIGMPRNRVSEAKASLVASRMLQEVPGGLVPNKNADQWIYPEGPAKEGKPDKRAGKKRLTDAALAYAKSGRKVRNNVKESESDLSGNPESRGNDLSGIPERPFRDSGTTFPGFRNDLSGIPESPPEPPYTDPAREDPTGLEIKKSKQDPHGPACEVSSDGEEPFVLPLSTPSGALPSSPEFERVIEKASRCGPEWHDWALEKAEPRGIYPPYWVYSILDTKVAGINGAKRINVRIATGILKNWARGEGNDIPPEKWPERRPAPAEVVEFTPRRPVPPPTRRSFDRD